MIVRASVVLRRTVCDDIDFVWQHATWVREKCPLSVLTDVRINKWALSPIFWITLKRYKTNCNQRKHQNTGSVSF